MGELYSGDSYEGTFKNTSTVIDETKSTVLTVNTKLWQN